MLTAKRHLIGGLPTMGTTHVEDRHPGGSPANAPRASGRYPDTPAASAPSKTTATKPAAKK